MLGCMDRHGPVRMPKSCGRLRKRGLASMFPARWNPPPAELPPKPFQKQFETTELRLPTWPLQAEWTFHRPEFEITLRVTTL